MRPLRQSRVCLGRTCYLPYGTSRRDVALGIDLFDVLIHGWDLATTVGAGFAMDEKATDAAFAVARLIVTAESQAQGQ